jgi:hypothetical protein
MIALSQAARGHLAALFAEKDTAQAQQLLEECTDNPRLLRDVMRQGADRILFAMIRLSDGDLGRLQDAIALFQRDWRDLLMASDFGHSIHAHETWRPRRLDQETIDGWMTNDLPEGVTFGVEAAVEIRFGQRRGTKGTVIGLLGLEPQPRYLVELPSGETVEVGQYSLQKAG